MVDSETVLLQFSGLQIYDDLKSEKLTTKVMASNAGFEKAMNIWKQVFTVLLIPQSYILHTNTNLDVIHCSSGTL